MKFFLLTDDADALMGLRLAGIEGKLIKTAAEAVSEYERLKADPETGILLLTHGTACLFGDSLTEMKKQNRPLIVQIPDTNPEHNPADAVADYIRDAVGVKI